MVLPEKRWRGRQDSYDGREESWRWEGLKRIKSRCGEDKPVREGRIRWCVGIWAFVLELFIFVDEARFQPWVGMVEERSNQGCLRWYCQKTVGITVGWVTPQTLKSLRVMVGFEMDSTSQGMKSSVSMRKWPDQLVMEMKTDKTGEQARPFPGRQRSHDLEVTFRSKKLPNPLPDSDTVWFKRPYFWNYSLPSTESEAELTAISLPGGGISTLRKKKKKSYRK